MGFWLALWLFLTWLLVVALLQLVFAAFGAALVGAAVLYLSKLNPKAMARASQGLTVCAIATQLPAAALGMLLVAGTVCTRN